jgi:hypothetical protein
LAAFAREILADSRQKRLVRRFVLFDVFWIGGRHRLSGRMQREIGWFVDEFKSVIDHS